MDTQPNWLAALRGRFLVFDGTDGSGKTTQFRWFAEFCRTNGETVTDVREPGGTAIGEQIRDILLDTANADMSVRCEMLLYMASRAQLVEQRIRPALERGEIVLADRFISSTLAYQGTAGGLSMEEILAVGRVAVGGLEPDLVVVFDVDERTAARRMGMLLDRMERKGAEFHRRVREGYLQQVRDCPERYVRVDAIADAEEVAQRLHETVRGRFPATARVNR